MKRIVDVFVSILGLMILSPLFLILSLLVKISSKGPIFFIQKRIGKEGKIFKMIKFRTMYIYQTSDSTISIKGDDRITGLGSFLRKYKLDELPELVNVLIGDMSLVGPRPDVSGYADRLTKDNKDILKIRLGITGPASLKYINEEEILAKQDNPQKYNDEVIYPDKVKINLDYYKNQSLWLDFKIIFATILRTFY